MIGLAFEIACGWNVMARPLRIEFPGALYHVTSRGNERKDIFFGDEDRLVFLETLGGVTERFNWLCHAYCLMTNHYHLLVETLDGNLSKGMRQLNGVYTQYVNRTHRRVGHLFQGRFKGILVQKEAYLLELARYIVLNPVRAGLVRRARDWRWSSYRASTGQVPAPRCLNTDWLLSAFGSDRRTALSGYKRFVTQGMDTDTPWRHLRNQVFLGSEAFVGKMQKRIRPEQPLREVPSKQRRPVAKGLDYYARRYRVRDRAIAEAYRSGAYSMHEIGTHFGVGRMTVSRAVKKREGL